DLLDPSKKSQVPVIGEGLAVALDHGSNSGNKMALFIKKILKNAGLSENLTFQELNQLTKRDNKYLELFLTAVNVTRTGQLQIFSHLTTPYVRIADAVAAAVAYPGLIQPYPILMNDKFENFIDGGLRDNFPFEIFPRSEWSKMLGLKVDTHGEIFGHQFKQPNLYEFLYTLVHDGEYEYKKHPQNRTIQFYDCDLNVIQTKH